MIVVRQELALKEHPQPKSAKETLKVSIMTKLVSYKCIFITQFQLKFVQLLKNIVLRSEKPS